MKNEFDRTKIDSKDIDGNGKPDGAPLDMLNDGTGFEREYKINQELKTEKKEKRITPLNTEVNLSVGEGLRLFERLFNKFLGSLVGNNPNPFEFLSWLNSTNLSLIFLIIIGILLIVLWIK